MKAVISVENHVVPTSLPFDLNTFKSKPRNVLVVSPHPDDDVIGAGGTMAILAGRGFDVFSLYVTDGNSLVFKSSGIPPERISVARQDEALDALRVVRARGGIFLRHKRRQLTGRGDRAVIGELREVLKFFMPEIVYVASPFERHMTHIRVTELTVKAIRQIKGYCPKIWGYNVWGGVYGLPGTNAVDITEVISIKTEAISMHKSQVQCKDYESGITGRNRYEGIFMETHKPDVFQFAETFLDMQELVLNKRLSLRAFSKKTIEAFLTHIQGRKVGRP